MAPSHSFSTVKDQVKMVKESDNYASIRIVQFHTKPQPNPKLQPQS